MPGYFAACAQWLWRDSAVNTALAQQALESRVFGRVLVRRLDTRKAGEQQYRHDGQ
ncbi:MAG: hypothetical protein HKN19_07280 [Halioglobus sp.]|nr:hypothetical protein [Halioglobus sp.]